MVCVEGVVVCLVDVGVEFVVFGVEVDVEFVVFFF